MSTLSDPWEQLGVPDGPTPLGRRVSDQTRWDFWWLRDASSCMMLLQLAAEEPVPGSLPHFRDLEVTHRRAPEGKMGGLVFRLTDDTKRDVFHSLCLDIVASTSDASSAQEAAKQALTRTWRWHHLLRGGSSDLLSAEEQRGLIGELYVLERILEPFIGLADSVTAWTGPEDAPKDFEIGAVLVESKARRGAAQPFVTISSEFQLDVPQGQRLFLHVVDVNREAHDSKEGQDLTSFCRHIKDLCIGDAPEVLIDLERKLASLGFRWHDDYSGYHWTIRNPHLYEVRDAFPCLASTALAGGIRNVRYDVSLNACETYTVDTSAIPLHLN